MDWTERTDLNRKTLQRIVALLLALAGLAERAAGRSRAVRWSVLWLLAPGEVIARDYVAALTGDPSLACPSVPTAIPRDADSIADTMRLAQAFRVLAAILASLLDDDIAWRRADIARARSASLSWRLSMALPPPVDPIPAVERRDSS